MTPPTEDDLLAALLSNRVEPKRDNEYTINEMMKATGLSKSGIMHKLDELRQAGALEERDAWVYKSGVVHVYWLKESPGG